MSEEMIRQGRGEQGGGERNPGEQDRAGQAPGYELRYFARKHGLTTAQAMDLIRRIGNDRAKLNEAAVRLRRAGQHKSA